jgi:hypothetical protein
MKYWFLNSKKMINKNFPINPNKGGIPARDNKLKNIIINIKLNNEKFLNSFKVRNLFKSNKKKMPNNSNKSIR